MDARGSAPAGARPARARARAQHRPHGRLLRDPWRRAGAAREDHDGAATVAAPARRGAWGITAATVGQARVMLAAGVRRVLIANEVTDPPAIAWIAAQLRDGERGDPLLRGFTSRGGAPRSGHARCSPAPAGPRRARPSRRARRIPQPRRSPRGCPAREDEALRSRWQVRPASRARSVMTERPRVSTGYERSSMGSPR